MAHKHFTEEEILGQIADGAKLPSCPQCAEKMERAQEKLAAIKKRYRQMGLPPAGEGAHQPKDVGEFISMLENRSVKEEGAKENVIRLRKRSALKIFLPAVAAAAVLLVALNLQYDKLLPQGAFAVVERAINLERKGLLWGEKTLIDNRVLCFKDHIATGEEALILDCNSLKIAGADLALSMEESADQTRLRLDGGKALITFLPQGSSPNNKKQIYKVFLPSGLEVTVTGTTLYFDVDGSLQKISLIEGSAQMARHGQMTPMVRERIYTVTEDKISDVAIGAAQGDQNQIKTLVKTIQGSQAKYPEGVKEMMIREYLNPAAGESTEKSMGGKAANGKRGTPLSLKEIKAKYGPLSVIHMNSGKEYIGAFRQEGDEVIIYTVKGEVTVPSEAVTAFIPYNEN